MTTKNDVLRALQREPLTVVQLCESLNVTRTAINMQLKQLEAEGLVRRHKPVQTGTPGKPAVLYEAAPGSEDATSSAYPAFLLALLATLQAHLDARQLEAVLVDTGRRLARENGLPASDDFDTNLASAMAVVDALGAHTEAVPDGNAIMVRNYSCPVASAVRETPCVCRAIAAYFSEATGRTVTDHCLREGRLICQYRIAKQ
ncbi:transcriptional regulator [Burkholderia lata]|uniref:Transcriptional regulator n=1 Tax=Burkholderia lata (strain ATCC 17760 / DSM 23089 / LMG 22485 / NCIMB 9086 / R18194 / 383) TaxID=482957 RepID=A0A6P2N4R1_BURL3|nr:MarR family transcriptional regulator [Burkholderia lata]VWB90028.1 transcriptional regulator [Burkholderia lata]